MHATKKKKVRKMKKKKKKKNKAGYTAQDAPSMRTFQLRNQHGTDGPTDRRTEGRTDTTP